MDSLSHKLDRDGFVIFRNENGRVDVDRYIKRIFDKPEDSKLVNNIEAKKFIDDVIIKTINQNGSGKWDAAYLKFRVSCNSNSSDASAFHRDNFAKPVPKRAHIYTALCYMDPAVLEIVKGSHKIEKASNIDAFTRYHRNVAQIPFNAGDVMIFNNSLLHRGIFTEKKKKDRRLVQVFDVTKSLKELEEYGPKICHVPARENYELKSKVSQLVSKSKFLISLPNFIGYMNAATGYGPDNDRFMNNTGCDVYSSEGNSGRTKLAASFSANNTYVVVRPDLLRDVTPRLNKYISYMCYQKPYLHYFMLILLFLAFVMIAMFFGVRKLVHIVKNKNIK